MLCSAFAWTASAGLWGTWAQILAELTANRVSLIVPSQSIDTSTTNPAAVFQLNVLCAVAEFERSLIKERVVAGIAAAKAKGVRFGRPLTAGKHLPEISAMVAQGKSTRQIASLLGIPKSTVATLARQARESFESIPDRP